jgi:hypothetical protein
MNQRCLAGGESGKHRLTPSICAFLARSRGRQFGLRALCTYCCRSRGQRIVSPALRPRRKGHLACKRSTSIRAHVFCAALTRIFATHPDVSIELTLSDQLVDLVGLLRNLSGTMNNHVPFRGLSRSDAFRIIPRRLCRTSGDAEEPQVTIEPICHSPAPQVAL